MSDQKLSQLPTTTDLASTDKVYAIDGLVSKALTVKDFGQHVTGVVDVVRDHDADNTGATDSAAKIQAAIDACAAAGGGTVFFPAGTYLIGTTLVTETGVYLVGEGIVATTLKADTGLNSAVIQSKNFATLTGQNKWFTTDGVQHDLGFFEFSIDGNKANQTSGRGIEIYAKKLQARGVFIRDCKDDGWYSEAADSGGQLDWTDNPESLVQYLFARNCDGNGIVIRGPHDAFYDGLYSNDNALWGLRVERSAAVYSGICYIGKAHIYSNTTGNIYNNAALHADMIVCENSFDVGWQVEAKINVDRLEMYSNCRTTGTYQLDFSASAALRSRVGSLEISDPSQASIGGVRCQVGFINFGHIDIFGNTGVSTGTGVFIDGAADFCQIGGGRITDFNAAGGVGLELNGNAAACSGTEISRLTVDDCDTIWENNSGGSFSHLQMVLDAKVGQTLFSGTGPNAGQSEDWQITGTDASGVRVMTRERGTPAGAINLNSATVQSLTFSHHMLLTPDEEDIQLSLRHSGGLSNFRYSGPWVTSITSTQVTASVAVTTAEGAAATGKLLFDIRI